MFRLAGTNNRLDCAFVNLLDDIFTMQPEHIGQWATPHNLSDVRRSAPSWIWDYLAHSDVTIYV